MGIPALAVHVCACVTTADHLKTHYVLSLPYPDSSNKPGKSSCDLFWRVSADRLCSSSNRSIICLRPWIHMEAAAAPSSSHLGGSGAEAVACIQMASYLLSCLNLIKEIDLRGKTHEIQPPTHHCQGYSEVTTEATNQHIIIPLHSHLHFLLSLCCLLRILVKCSYPP